MCELKNARTALRVARRDNGKKSRKIAAQATMRLDQHRFLAGVGRGSGKDGAIADRGLKCRQSLRVRGRVRDVELEVAGGGNAGRTEVAVAGGVRGRLRKT